MNLHHINIKGPGELLEQEKEFFCDVLGLREGHRPDFSSRGYWLYSEEKPIVHLTESEKHFKNEKQGFFDHVAFQSSDLKKLVQLLTNKGVGFSIVSLPETDMTQVFMESPSGTGIEINFENEKISNAL